MITKLIYLPVLLLLSALLSLWGIVYANTHRNGFKRVLLSDKITLLRQRPISGWLSKICGNTQNKVFFSGYNPHWVMSTDYTFSKLDSLYIPIPVPVTSDLLSAFEFSVDSPKVELYAPNLPAIFSYKIGEDKAAHYLKLPLFTRYVSLNDQSLIVRGFDSSRQLQYFTKVDKRTGNIISNAVQLLYQPRDGGLSTDGMLRYDSITHAILYVQLYQNIFYYLDTSLNLKYIGKTIDTTNTNPIKTKTFIDTGRSGSIIPSTPVIPVNKDCYFSNGLLYIISGLVADNEEPDVFLNTATDIDIYDIKHDSYIGSFSIPNPNREKVKSFRIDNHLLIVLYERSVALYRLNII